MSKRVLQNLKALVRNLLARFWQTLLEKQAPPQKDLTLNSKELKDKENNMSFVTIIKDIESIPSKLEADLAKLANEAPKLESIVAATLKYAGPVLQVAISVTDPAALPLVTEILSEASVDLTVATNLTKTIGLTPSVSNIISGISSNLSGLLTASKVTNPKSVASITSVVSVLNTTVAAIAVSLPAVA